MCPRLNRRVLVSIVVILGLTGCGSRESETPLLQIGPSVDCEVMSSLELTETEKLLILSTALHGSSPDELRGETRARARGSHVLGQAFVWGGVWNGRTCLALYQGEADAVVDEWYGTLIDLCRRKRIGQPLVCSVGNVGGGYSPRSAPAYVAFGLTDAGWECAEKLFLERPHLREKQPPVESTGLESDIEFDDFHSKLFNRISMSESEFQQFALDKELNQVYCEAEHHSLLQSWPPCGQPWWNPPESLDGARFSRNEQEFAIAKYDDGYVYRVIIEERHASW